MAGTVVEVMRDGFYLPLRQARDEKGDLLSKFTARTVEYSRWSRVPEAELVSFQ